MNLQEMHVLNSIKENGFISQRNTASITGHSLGIVNKSLKSLIDNGYLNCEYSLTDKSKNIFKEHTPNNAIILAAGYGMRIESVNKEIPKGLLEVKGDILIERIITQLKESGINKIYVVVGFLKEQYEYLIDKYDVELIISASYKKTGNLQSLSLTSNILSNSYIIPCDLWFRENPFSQNELYSWYMVSDENDEFSSVRINRKKELVSVDYTETGNKMVGLSYISYEDAPDLVNRISMLCKDKRYIGAFWEEALYKKDNKFLIPAKLVSKSDVSEINTYDQLKKANNIIENNLDVALKNICNELDFSKDKITNIECLKQGVTNYTCSFETNNSKYVLRIPEFFSTPIDRHNEKKVYEELNKHNIGDQVLFLDETNGYKLSKYIYDHHCCNKNNNSDLICYINSLRDFHSLNLKTDKFFDVFEKINFYESLFENEGSAYKDYNETKSNIFKLKDFIDNCDKTYCITHMDDSCNNYLISDTENKGVIIDWEYAAMQDPHMDIAILALNSMFDKAKTDWLIDIYFNGDCPVNTRYKIYAYIAVCGFMWSNWCESYRIKGVDFGEYSMKQYRYAKEYSRLVLDYI